MKVWKILDSMKLVAYVQISDCKIYDDSYAALQLVRKKFNNFNISGTQVLNISSGEKMQEGVPVLLLE